MSECGSIPDVGCCLNGSALTCKADEGLVEWPCGLYGCGWNSVQGRAKCDAIGTPPPEYALECNPDCVPACEGKECGSNGCGAICGKCAANEACEDGVCVCVPACDGRECGDDGCGGACGTCASGHACEDGACVCVPACEGRECGADGCGGTCGACGQGFACQAGLCVFLVGCGNATCEPDLLETCATCPADCECGCGEACEEGGCVFTACDGKECGDDGCGGTCGTCANGDICTAGVCGCGVEVTVDPGLLPASVPQDIAGTYAESFACTMDDVPWYGPFAAHCFRKTDGSGWRIWNNAHGWAIGRKEGTPSWPWVFYARTYAGGEPLPEIQKGPLALTTSVFYNSVNAVIPGLSSTTTCTCAPNACGAGCGSCSDGMVCSVGVCTPESTWTDPVSGLTWQNPAYGGTLSGTDALSYCQGLALDGGGWHLPTIDELRTLVRGCPATEPGGTCNVHEGGCLSWSCPDAACNGCASMNGPGERGCYWPVEMKGTCEGLYWSSTPVDGLPSEVWDVHFLDGRISSYGTYYVKNVRCVR